MTSQAGNSAVSDDAKRVDRVLRDTRVELATAKKILAEDKRVAKRAKDKTWRARTRNGLQSSCKRPSILWKITTSCSFSSRRIRGGMMKAKRACRRAYPHAVIRQPCLRSGFPRRPHLILAFVLANNRPEGPRVCEELRQRSSFCKKK
jgi:hypothetical protein